MKFSAPIVGILVAVILTVGFWFLLYKPASEDQAAVEAQTAQLDQQAQSLRTQIAALEAIEARQVEIRAALARLEEYIPPGPAQPATIRQFQRAADASGAEIATITFGEPAVPVAAEGAVPADTGVPGTTLANIPVTMALEGGYFQLVDFFRRLEVDVPRAVLIQTVNVTEETEEGFPTLLANWTGEIFSIVESGDLVDTAAGVPAPAPGGTPTPTPTPTTAEGGGQ